MPFLDLLPFQGPFPLTGALTGRPVSYEKTPYELQESLREATGRDFTRIGREFPLVRRRPKKVVFSYGGAVSGPFRDLSFLQGPLRANRLMGRPLTGRFLTRRPLTNYRKAYGKLRGVILPELGGNFRLCAVDQKRSFFPRAVPFLGLLPFKGPFPLTGALTGRPPYGKVPYGQTALREGPLRGGFLPEGPLRITGKLTGSYGEGLYQNWAGISACAP